MKQTKGEWIVSHGASNLPSIGSAELHKPIAHICKISEFGKGTHPFDDEAEANAELIAEAGTVANETGYTPRQLAEQVERLEKSLAEFKSDLGREVKRCLQLAEQKAKLLLFLEGQLSDVLAECNAVEIRDIINVRKRTMAEIYQEIISKIAIQNATP